MNGDQVRTLEMYAPDFLSLGRQRSFSTATSDSFIRFQELSLFLHTF